MLRVLLAGEGANEIGRFAREAVDEARTSDDGVIVALMSKVRVGGWEIRNGIQWKDVRKLRANRPGDGDIRTVHALALHARERGCHALVFLRDRDGKPARERVIQAACAAEESKGGLRLAGGVPVEMLECWLLALRGERNSQREAEPVAALHLRHGVPPKRTAAMVQLVRNARLPGIPEDAASLWRWLRSVALALNVVPIPKAWPRPPQ